MAELPEIPPVVTEFASGPMTTHTWWTSPELASIRPLEASPLRLPNEVTGFIIPTVDPVRSSPFDLLSSSLPAATTIPPPSTATPISPPSQDAPHSSSSTIETTKLIIGLAVAITVLVLLVTISSASYYIVRKRRRRKRETKTKTAHQDVSNNDSEGHSPQMYLQQKVELDDEQRRHEMEATAANYELEGADRVYEVPAGERGRHNRPELSGEDRSKGLDKPF